MKHYEIGGKDGVWTMVTSYVWEDNVIAVFQNIGSGEYMEIEISPFDWIINKNIEFKKWQQ
jgi:hypothetical protein